MATLYKVGGVIEEIQPADGKAFKLKELQTIVGGWIELAPVKRHVTGVLVIDEEGKLKDKPYNYLATLLYEHSAHDYIVGDALLVRDRAEFAGEEDDQDYQEVGGDAPEGAVSF